MITHQKTTNPKKTHILGGGTIYHVRPHLALAAPAYGYAARQLEHLCQERCPEQEVILHLTRMANEGKGNLETNEDVDKLLETLVKDETTQMIFMPIALVDYTGRILLDEETLTRSGKYEERLSSRKQSSPRMQLHMGRKLIGEVRKERKDIYLVAFKTTCGANEDEQYLNGLNLLKENSCNLVLANDLKTRTNIIITPEEARYHVTQDREEALSNLVDMAYLRANLNFTRSTLVPGEPVSWSSELVPSTLRTVVDYCIAQGAYKPFRGSTAGHFAVKLDDRTFLTSRRKTNFNRLNEIGLVKVEADGPDSVIAYGGKPSVGGQSQRILFNQHPEYDCIVHFHCPPKLGVEVPKVSQRPYECGSHECGQNTANGLRRMGDLSLVYLDNHGPNLVFHHTADPRKIIDFIDRHFDLKQKTGGLVA